MTLQEFCDLSLKEQQAHIMARAAADNEDKSFSCRKLGDEWGVPKWLLRCVIHVPGKLNVARRLTLADHMPEVDNSTLFVPVSVIQRMNDGSC